MMWGMDVKNRLGEKKCMRNTADLRGRIFGVYWNDIYAIYCRKASMLIVEGKHTCARGADRCGTYEAKTKKRRKIYIYA